VTRVLIHITTDLCEELEGCELSGFHFHWRGRIYRSAFDGAMTPEEAYAFDADCAADHAEREEAR
jgi:hypothetical protein